MTTNPSSRAHNDPPPAVAKLLQQAGRALDYNQPAPAEQLLGQALELAPDSAEAHRLMGITALVTGRHRKAIEHLRRALTQRPNDATINMTLGSALVESGSTEEGLAHLKRTCELAPDDAEAWYNLGIALEFTCFVLNVTGNMERTRDAFERVVEINPRHINARNKLAIVMITLGDAAAAVQMLRGTLRLQPDCVDAWITLGNLKTERLGSQDVRQLRDLLARRDLTDNARASLAFTLAKAQEDQSEYAAAFDTVSAANALMRRQLYWNRVEGRARVDAIAQAFAHASPGPSDATFGEEVIFVVCLPRSASTLTEQILAAHPQVEGGGEIDVLSDILGGESERRGQPFPEWVPAASRADWRRLGEAYLERTRGLREQYPRFTDKSADNWAYVGAALAMLPGARVVNSRRDPLETCFACYRQLFPFPCHFAYDLDDIVDYYAGYERLSRLWRQQFPQRYFDHQYEALQKNAKGQIRRLLDFCHLPFDPACLDFHQSRRAVVTLSSSQVREPLRQDTARSALYGTKLDPLRAKLRAAGVPVADA